MNGTVQSAQLRTLSALLGPGSEAAADPPVSSISLMQPRFSTHSCDAKRESNSASPAEFLFISLNGKPLDQDVAQ
jgi:hypothetical protein